MKKLLILVPMLITFGVASSQISDIYNGLNNGKEFLYASEKVGCLTLNKSSFKQSYYADCKKTLDFTINTMELKSNRIYIDVTMHYYSDTKLVGFIEIKDNLLVITYGESWTSQQQVDKYKLK